MSESHATIERFMTSVINDSMNHTMFRFISNLYSIRDYVYRYEESNFIPVFDDDELLAKFKYLTDNSQKF
jgi:hypothetical protein